MERRLAAILAADVANYSLLMNTDEGATYSAWRSARAEVVDPRIDEFKGRIVKHTGDGFLAEFPTALAAVDCAVGMQSEMNQRDVHVAGDRAFQFRIGINLGDIIVDDEDIHGDGVNIAARLEGIAEAGGVCISADVYRQVNNKPGFSFQDLGERSVKNIRAPIRVYAVTRGEAGVVAPLPAAESIADTPTVLAPSLESVLASISTPAYGRAALVVGRERELETLAEACREATAQRGNIVLIRGEPGIGKSCLALSFTERAREAGARVVFGQCHETLGSPPFWPWLQVLKSLHKSGDSALGASATIFEGMTAAQSAPASSAPSTFPSGVGSEQFLLFNRIANFLAEMARGQTLLIVLDDLHWADRSSLLLLTHLCRKLAEHAILIIGTYREMEVTRKHPLFESLGEIGRESKLRRIGLKGLSAQEVSDFLQSSIEQVLPEEILQALYEKTEGNPLFVSEVVGILQQETSRLDGEQIELEIPDGIQEVIGRRLNCLSEECNDTLARASVIGRRFNLRVLTMLLPEADQMHTLKTLEEATGRGILRESEAGVGEFQFSHVLIRDILYNELSLTKKVLLHGQVADALATLEKKGTPQSPGEIARHYYQALQAGQGEKALDYAIRAAQHAFTLAAFDEARGYYELALEVISFDEEGHEVLQTSTLLDIVNCMHAAGESNVKAIATMDRCLDAARRHQHHAVFAKAACRKVYQARAPSQVPAALAAIDEALSYVADDDLMLRADVLAHRALALTFNSCRVEAEQVAYAAIALAEKSADVRIHCNALCMALLALRGRPEKLSERILLGEQALKMSLSNADTYRLDPLEWLILSYQEAGDMERTRQLIAMLDESVKETKLFKSHYFAAGARACLALFDGHWQSAEALIEEAVEIGSGSLDGGADGVYGAQMFLLNRELGRLPMIHAALQNMVSDRTPMWTPGLLATYTDLGMLDEARDLFTELAADDFSRVLEDEMYLICLVYLTEACMELDYSDKASALFQRLGPYSGQMVSHPTAVCYGPADLYLGMLSSQMNKLAEAEDLFNSAVALCEKSTPNMWQAHIKYRHAQVLKRHNFSGGKSVFHKLAGESRSLAQSLGMVNLLARIDRLESESAPDDTNNNDGLTPRELEVLSLIAQGKSNKSIAAGLNRSLATVATHVRAILNKTRTANRTEAAAYAIERNLCNNPDSAGSGLSGA